MVQPFWKTVWQFLKKLKIELPYDPAIPFLDTFDNIEISISTRQLHTMAIAPLFTIVRRWK